MAVSMSKVELLEIQLEEIASATNNFNHSNCIGGGGFGKVYKGALPQFKEHNMVAIKRLDRIYGQGDTEYLKEITMLSCYTHENLISLLGYCKQGTEMILVYEHASRGSLDRHLHSADLTWKQRLKICLGAAKGLNYLHDPRETSQRLIHCDIKSANILLDDEWNAKVADFGLSKIAPANPQNSMLITSALGTVGYCDPLFLETYELTKESDVYSFGVVLFEVLCGKVCTRTRNGQLQVLVYMWKKSYEEKKLNEIMCPNLRQNMDWNSLEIFSDIAFQCLKRTREERPRMSLVVEKLETALRCLWLKLPKEYEEIVNAAVPPLIFESMEELKVLLSKGFFINDGKTRFSIIDKKEHILLISTEECLIINSWNSNQYSLEYNSRFEVGTYTTRRDNFKARVTPQYLLPCITYAVNLIFKCPQISKKKSWKQHMSLGFTLLNLGEERRSIVYIGDKRKDDWLRARLHHFTTSNHSRIKVLEFNFEYHEYSLQIEGIEFQQLKVNVEELKDDIDENKYQQILKSAEPRLMYTSLQELKLILSKGLLINSETWFHLNDKGQHCEFISIKECLVPYPNTSNHYDHDYNSRFLVGSLNVLSCYFKVHVRAQFLTPFVTYTLNLVFKFLNSDKDVKEVQPKEAYIALRYKVEGQTETSCSYLAEKRELDDWWMVELCQFTSEQGATTADVEISFHTNDSYIVVDGIEFLPVEEVDKLYMEGGQVLDDEKVDDDMQMQHPISSSDSNSHSDIYWEQKLPNDYDDIIKMAKDSVPMNATKKELYSFLSKGFLTNNGQEWLSIDKNGKICLMLSPRVACAPESMRRFKWRSSHESRFGDECSYGEYGSDFAIKSDIRSKLLSPEIRYETYLVYKLPATEENRFGFDAPLKMKDGRDLGSNSLYVYLVGGSRSPVVINVRGGKVVIDGNIKTRNNSSNIPNLKDRVFPKERRDGWMEVQISEFQTPSTITATTTNPVIPISLKFKVTNFLEGLIIQGIEFRPV